MTSPGTNLIGQYQGCGPGQGFSLQLQCNGPNCGALAGFPGLQCQTISGGQSCSNGVVCKEATSPAHPSSSAGSGSAPPPPPSLNSSGVASSFSIQQDPQTGQTTSNQNLDIQGQSVILNATSNGTATIKYGDIIVSNNGTTSPSPPASSTTSKTSSSPKTYRLSNLFLIALVFLSMFVGQIHAQSVTWADVLSGLPQDNIQFIESLEPQLCESTIPVINAAVCGGQQSFLSVADIARICLQTVGQAPQPQAATSNDGSQLVFALGNTIACNQIANAMLADPQGDTGRDLCDPYVPFSTCTTSVFTTEFTSSGLVMVSTLSTVSQSSAAVSAAATTSGGASSEASSEASPSAVVPSTATVTSTAAAVESSIATIISTTSSSTAAGSESTSTTEIATVVSSVIPVPVPLGSSTSSESSLSSSSSSTGNATAAIKHRRHGGMLCEDEGL